MFLLCQCTSKLKTSSQIKSSVIICSQVEREREREREGGREGWNIEIERECNNPFMKNYKYKYPT